MKNLAAAAVLMVAVILGGCATAGGWFEQTASKPYSGSPTGAVPISD